MEDPETEVQETEDQETEDQVVQMRKPPPRDMPRPFRVGDLVRLTKPMKVEPSTAEEHALKNRVGLLLVQKEQGLPDAWTARQYKLWAERSWVQWQGFANGLIVDEHEEKEEMVYTVVLYSCELGLFAQDQKGNPMLWDFKGSELGPVT